MEISNNFGGKYNIVTKRFRSEAKYNENII